MEPGYYMTDEVVSKNRTKVWVVGPMPSGRIMTLVECFDGTSITRTRDLSEVKGWTKCL